MASLDNGAIVQRYGANTKINVVQETMVNGVRYFRTASAVKNGLNLAIKANSFNLPPENAPLEPSFIPTHSLSDNSKAPRKSSAAKQKVNQNVAKGESSKSGESPSPDRKGRGIFRRFLDRFKH